MNYPRNIIIEVTQRCNLNCVMCSRRIDRRPQGDLSLELFKKLERALPMIKLVILTGHGESLLHKDFFEMLRICKAAGCKTRIITNATVMDDEMAKRLVTYGLDELIVSMDAAEKDLFEKIRTGASFDTVMNNIRRVNRFKRELKSATPLLVFEIVGMEQNVRQLPALVKLAKEMGAARVGIATLAEHNPEVRGQSLRRHPDLLKKYLIAAEKTAKKLGVRLECGEPYLEVLGKTSIQSPVPGRLKWLSKMITNTASDLRTLDGRTYLFRTAFQRSERALASRNLIKSRRIAGTKVHCSDPWEFAFIRWDGKVRPCCASDRIIGDLAENSFDEIWHADAYQIFRSMVSSGQPPVECMRCTTRRKTTYVE
ncbi:MAG: radical SAM protein [bacterium]